MLTEKELQEIRERWAKHQIKVPCPEPENNQCTLPIACLACAFSDFSALLDTIAGLRELLEEAESYMQYESDTEAKVGAKIKEALRD
jgi:hypothetical protein